MQSTSGKDSMGFLTSMFTRSIRLGLLGILFCAIPGMAAFDLLLENPDARDAARAESSLAMAEGLMASLRNPAGLAAMDAQEFGLSYVDHLQDISLLGASWGGLEWRGNRLALHFLRLDWGELDGMDDDGASTGTFSAGESLVLAGIARRLPGIAGGSLNAGLQTGFIHSTIDDASASALVLNAGLGWQRERARLALALRNAGSVLSEYSGSPVDLPLSLDLGGAYRLKHLPFTLSLAWRKVRDRDAYVMFGGGFEFGSRWQLDFGYHVGRGDDRLTGVSGESSRGFAAGVGGKLPRGFRFHWAWSSYGELGSLNRFTLGWQPQRGNTP
jgi:hypothetical protein